MRSARVRGRVVAAMLTACVMAACGESQQGSTPVRDLQGNAVDPLAGGPEIKVLVFMATTCPISNRYAPTLAQLDEAWPDERVATWRVYPDGSVTPDEVRAHGEAYALPGHPVIDGGHRLVARAGATVTPEVAVFVRDESEPRYRGRIDDRASHLQGFQGRFRNDAGSEDLRRAVDALLQGRDVPSAHTSATGCYIEDLKERKG